MAPPSITLTATATSTSSSTSTTQVKKKDKVTVVSQNNVNNTTMAIGGWPVQQKIATMIGLRYSADLRCLTCIALYYIWSTCLWKYGSFLPWAVWFPAWVTLLMLSFSGATMTHNTMHRAMFPPTYFYSNFAVRMLLSVQYGHPVSSFVPGHNMSHHRHTQLPKDHMRTTKLRYKWNLLNLALYQPTVAHKVLVGDIRYTTLQHQRGRPFARQMIREMGFVLAVSAFLIYTDLIKFVLYFQIPHIFAQFWIVSVNLLQHDGCDVHENGDQHGNIARNFVGTFLNYILFNNGYHSIHHLKPTLHWSLLPEAHAKEVSPNIHPNLELNSMVKYIFQSTIYPGKRLTYDGKPVVFNKKIEEDVDVDWVPRGQNLPEEVCTLKNLVSFSGDYVLLVISKLISPMYSPFVPLQDIVSSHDDH